MQKCFCYGYKSYATNTVQHNATQQAQRLFDLIVGDPLKTTQLTNILNLYLATNGVDVR